MPYSAKEMAIACDDPSDGKAFRSWLRSHAQDVQPAVGSGSRYVFDDEQAIALIERRLAFKATKRTKHASARSKEQIIADLFGDEDDESDEANEDA